MSARQVYEAFCFKQSIQTTCIWKKTKYVVFVRKLHGPLTKLARIFFPQRILPSSQTYILRVQANWKVALEKYTIPCPVQPFLLSFQTCGSRTKSWAVWSQSLVSVKDWSKKWNDPLLTIWLLLLLLDSGHRHCWQYGCSGHVWWLWCAENIPFLTISRLLQIE